MNEIVMLSPAKINLTLDVFSKDSEAPFHKIETIYHKLEWGDEMVLKNSEKFEIIGNFDCPLEENLIYKSFLLIKKFTQKTSPVRVEIKKNIPTQAGLGGGSSNAATFVQSYFNFFDLGNIPTELIEALGELGKDIPFFFHNDSCAQGTNFGEVITPVNFNFSETTVYLYFPNFKSDTTQAYQKLKTFDTNYTQEFLKNPSLKNCANVFKDNYEQNIYTDLNLSGSGSTFFSFDKINIPNHKIIEAKLF